MRKTEHYRAPEYPERASAEKEDRPYIFEHMHHPERIDSEHENEQDRYKTEAAVDHKLRHHCPRQTEHVADSFTIRQTSGPIETENVLIVGAGE